MTIAVIGSTGTIGSRVVRALSEEGLPVRAVLRDPAKASALPPDIDLAVADLAKAEEVNEALKGADRIVLIPANGPDQVRQERHVIDAAEEYDVTHLVKLSVGGAASDAPLSLARDHWAAEQRLQEGSVRATVVRPGFFMQNLLQYRDWIAADGTWSLPLGAEPIAMVHASDVADVIGTLVIGDALPDLPAITGAVSVSMAQAAEMLSSAAGRRLSYVPGDPEEFFERLIAEGYEQTYARDLTFLYDQVIGGGYASQVSTGVQQVLGREPRSFAEFAAESAGEFGR